MDEEETLQAVTELSSMSDHFTDLFSVTLTIHHETCCPVGDWSKTTSNNNFLKSDLLGEWNTKLYNNRLWVLMLPWLKHIIVKKSCGGGVAAGWSGHRTWNLEILSSSSPLITSWICSGSLWFNSSAVLVHSQLVCLLPVRILNLLSFLQYFV